MSFNDNLEQGISSEETVPKCIEENKDAEVHYKLHKDAEVHNKLHKDAAVHDKSHKDAAVHDKSHIEHGDKGSSTNKKNDPMREEINFEQQIESRLPFVRQMEIMENSIVKITEKLSDHIIAQNDNKIDIVSEVKQVLNQIKLKEGTGSKDSLVSLYNQQIKEKETIIHNMAREIESLKKTISENEQKTRAERD